MVSYGNILKSDNHHFITHMLLYCYSSLPGQLEEGIFLVQTRLRFKQAASASLDLPSPGAVLRCSDRPPNHQLPPSLCDLLCCSVWGGGSL